jgi:hypothetical protein
MCPITGVETTTNGASNHVGKLNSYAHMRGRQENGLDKVVIIGSERTLVLNDAMVA